MIAHSRVIAVVPARGGSKGLPGKNVKPFLNKPLIAWTLDAARASAYIDTVVVSTDDDLIAQAAAEAGYPPPFRRPDALSGDKASVVDAVLHALDALEGPWDYVVLLQPTSPLRLASDIDAAIELCDQSGAPAVVTVSSLPKPNNFLCTVGEDGVFQRFEQTLDGELMMLNGAVYVIRAEVLRAERKFSPEGTLAMTTPFERAWDIDTLYDFIACEALAPKILAGEASVLNAVRR